MKTRSQSVAESGRPLRGSTHILTVSRDRLIELNKQAADLFTARYPTSWAPGYLRGRLGADLTGDKRFTDRQADQLRPHIADGRPGIIVATDADTAGQEAAARAYWQLIDRGEDPRCPPMAAGWDPADILCVGGPMALRELLDQSGSLAEHLLDRVLANALHHPGDQPAAIRSAAEIIAPLPPDQWLPHIDRVTDALRAAPGSVHLAVLDAGRAWTLDPAGQAHARVRATDHDRRLAPQAERVSAVRPPTRHSATAPDRRAYAQEPPPSSNRDRDRATGPVR